MLIRQSAAYMVANGCSAALGFLAVVVFTQLLAPADYGLYVVASSMGTILAALLFTWLRQSILRFESEGGGADVRLTALAGYVLSMAILPLALGVLVVAARLPWVTAAAAVLLAAALSFYDLGQELLRARLQAGSYMIAAVVRSVVSLALAVAAIKAGGGGLGLVAAVACAYGIAALVSARAVWRRPLKPFDRAMLSTFLAFGAPITVSGVLFAIHMGLDRLVVFRMVGAEAAGHYGASADFVRQCIVYPALSASLAIAPLAVRTFASAGADAARRHLAIGGELLLVLIAPAVVGIAVTAPDIAAVVFGPQYRAAAATLMPVIALAWLFYTLSQHFVHLSFNLAQKPSLYIIHGAGTLGLNAALIVPLVQSFGAIGAAWSFLLAEAGGLVLGGVLARRAFPLPNIWTAAVRVATASLVMGGAVHLVVRSFAAPGFVSLLAGVATGVLVYAALAFALDLVGARALVRRLADSEQGLRVRRAFGGAPRAE